MKKAKGGQKRDTRIKRFEKAVYTLPILFGSMMHTDRVAKIQKFSQKKYNLKLPIDSFFGAPTNSLWNGGRPPHYTEFIVGDWTKQYYENIDAHKYLTYTNYLAGDYLDDWISNLSLEMLSKDDGVIITDERLYKYIRKTYPKLKTKASVVKVSKEQPHERSADYYNQLLDRYDYILFHPDDNTNLDLIAQVKDLSRVEVLIDERCTRNCPIRDLHYNINAQRNLPVKDRDNSILEQEDNLWNNMCPREKSIFLKNGKEKLDILVNTIDEIQDLYDMGIHRFKTSGRGSALNESVALKKFLYVAIKDEQTRNTLEYFL
jgi:collagenase-like PrtC family protease